jgi:hypothetical protein
MRAERDQRAHQPLPQHPSAHRRGGAIEHVQQGTVVTALNALNHVQMAQRHRIDQQGVCGNAVRDVAHVRDVAFLCFAQVQHDGARGRDCRRR